MMKPSALILLFFVNLLVFSQTNILLQNKNLLFELSKYDRIYQVSDSIIQFQLDSLPYKTNFGFGVARRKDGKLIYPADTINSYRIANYRDVISIAKGSNLGKLNYGLIDFNGNILLDFKYDRIGGVFVPLPDSIITVQKGTKFAIFNIKNKKLSDFKYDNLGYCLNDGYSYHTGGSHKAKKIIYKQLGLENYHHKIIIPKDYNNEVTVSNKDGKYFLVNKKNEIISNKYYVLRRIWGVSNQKLYFIATYYNEPFEKQRYKLIDKKGVEIAEMTKYQPNCNEYYITLTNKTYFFIDTKKVIKIPDNLSLFVDCYAKEGVLGFKNIKTGDKFFIDKYGNSITENNLK